MSNNALLDWTNQQSGAAGHSRWAQYHPACLCATCQNLRAFSGGAQDYANRSLAQVANYFAPPIEMTAADLGLPEVDVMKAALLRMNTLYRGMPFSDAPYSFWLGTDRPNPLDGTRLWNNS